MALEPVILDFETEAIQDRPNYPPKPVGVAIMIGDDARYYAWGHPTGNNCSEEHAKRIVANLATDTSIALVMHNAKFDLEVMQKWAGEMPPSDRWHDTMLLAFLDNPHSDTLALKPLCEKMFDLPPEERDAVRDWLVENGIEKKSTKGWGRSISKAPGDLVGRYAVGDVVRTKKLFDTLHLRVIGKGMASAYSRERELVPILIENEQQGIVCDVKSLKKHERECSEDFVKIDKWICDYLGCGEINLDENETLADALERAGKVDKWELTETGVRSTAKPALGRMLSDRLLYAALMYRGSMATCLRTFMRPWLELSASNNGRLYTTWNTTKQEEGGGTRTGRLSSSKPLNLQNIPNDFSEKFGELFAETNLLEIADVGELPTLRSYIVADSKDHVLLGRDFSSQEPRTFAHFEAGWLMQQYIDDPRMDVYKTLVAATKEKTGVEITRKQAKTVFLGILYGMGVSKLAGQLDLPVADAHLIKSSMLEAAPSIAKVTRMIKDILSGRGKDGETKHVRTWGGRVYHVEPPKMINGQIRTFEYKGLNMLVQGSAADETKEALIRYYRTARDSRLLLQVHDELVITCHRDVAQREMENLRQCMGGLGLRVPLLSEGEYGYRWGQMKEYKDV